MVAPQEGVSPKPAFARFALAGFAAALVLAACGDDEPAPATPTATPSPVATPTPAAPSVTRTPALSPTTPPSPPQETPLSTPAATGAIALQVSPGASFPVDTALILETGCWQCDGPPTGLLRVYRRPGGDFSIETLLDPIIPESPRPSSEGAPLITGYAMAPDLSEIVVGICISGTCATDGLYSWSAESILAIYSSVDGGVTWEKMGEVGAGIGMYGILAPGRYLVARSEVRNERTYEVFPDGEPVQPPPGAKWILDVVDGEPLWWTEENSRILRQDGSTYVDFGSDTRLWRASSDGSSAVLVWGRTTQNRTEHFVSVIRNGSTSSYSVPGLAMAIPYRGDVLLANVTYSPDIYGPSMIDIRNRTAVPFGEPFTRPDFPSGRNYIVAAQTGPFARVVNTGSCLNIRGAPSLDSNVITCAADRVLLRDQGETAEGDGVAWVRVTTPSGAAGWAAAVYLER